MNRLLACMAQFELVKTLHRNCVFLSNLLSFIYLFLETNATLKINYLPDDIPFNPAHKNGFIFWNFGNQLKCI